MVAMGPRRPRRGPRRCRRCALHRRGHLPRLRQMGRATTCETWSESSHRASVLLCMAVRGAAVSPWTAHRMAWAAQGCARPWATVRAWNPRSSVPPPS